MTRVDDTQPIETSLFIWSNILINNEFLYTFDLNYLMTPFWHKFLLVQKN